MKNRRKNLLASFVETVSGILLLVGAVLNLIAQRTRISCSVQNCMKSDQTINRLSARN